MLPAAIVNLRAPAASGIVHACIPPAASVAVFKFWRRRTTAGSTAADPRSRPIRVPECKRRRQHSCMGRWTCRARLAASRCVSAFAVSFRTPTCRSHRVVRVPHFGPGSGRRTRVDPRAVLGNRPRGRGGERGQATSVPQPWPLPNFRRRNMLIPCGAMPQRVSEIRQLHQGLRYRAAPIGAPNRGVSRPDSGRFALIRGASPRFGALSTKPSEAGGGRMGPEGRAEWPIFNGGGGRRSGHRALGRSGQAATRRSAEFASSRSSTARRVAQNVAAISSAPRTGQDRTRADRCPATVPAWGALARTTHNTTYPEELARGADRAARRASPPRRCRDSCRSTPRSADEVRVSFFPACGFLPRLRAPSAAEIRARETRRRYPL